MNTFRNRVREIVQLFWREVAKFGVVGGAAFLVDSGLYLWLLSGPMHDSEVWARALATAVASIFSWIANRYWTFRDRKRDRVLREACLFAVMNFVGLLIASGCVWFTKYILGRDDRVALFVAGCIVGVLLGTIFRFFAYRFWVFGDKVEGDLGFAPDGVSHDGGHGEGADAKRTSLIQQRKNDEGSPMFSPALDAVNFLGERGPSRGSGALSEANRMP